MNLRTERQSAYGRGCQSYHRMLDLQPCCPGEVYVRYRRLMLLRSMACLRARAPSCMYLLQGAGIVIELGLYICEAVDTGNDLGSVLSETVEDDAERFLTNFVGHLGDLDSAFSGSV